MKHAKNTWILAAALALMVLAGCHEYRAVVEIRPDGSGTRTVTLAPQLDEALSEQEMHMVFRVSPDEGWQRVASEDGHVSFRRVRTASGPDSWAALGDDVRIFSRRGGDSGDKRKGPTGLTNTVSLETGRTDEGRTYTYRETLHWAGLKEDLTAVMAAVYEKRVREAVPDLSDVCVAELRGLFRAHMSQTWEQVRLSEDEDLFTEALSRAMLPDVTELVDRRGVDVEPELLAALAIAVLEDDDNQLESVVERDLIGVAHAMFASLKLSVIMPGEIFDTNGSRDADGAASWSVGLLDPMDKHVELFARSLVRD